MIDLDREMRALLEEDARKAPPVPDAAPTLRRARRRQVGVVLAALAVMASLAMGSIAGVSALLRSSERRVPLEPPEPFRPGAFEAVAAQPISFDWLVADTEGRLWSNRPGLTVFDPASGTFRTFTAADDPAFAGVGSLAPAPITPAREGGVWVETDMASGGQIRRFDGERFVEETAPVSGGVIAEAPDGTIWLGGGSDVLSWNGESWRVAPSAGRPSGEVGYIAVDTAGNVWVAEYIYPGPQWLGISRFDGNTWTSYPMEEVLPSDRLGVPQGGADRGAVWTIVAGADGDVWVGGRGGVAHFVDGVWTSYPSAPLGMKNVGSVAVASDGTVWIGGGAIARFDGTTWIPVVEGLEGKVWRGVAAGPSGVWAATGAGLFRLDGTHWVRATSELRPSDVDGPLEAVGEDELWMGDRTGLGGLWHLQGDGWTHFGQDEGLPGGPGGWVNALQVAPDGAVWAVVNGELARFDGVAWERVEPGVRSALGLAPDGRVWTASLLDENHPPIWSVHPIGGAALPPLDTLVDVSSIAVGPTGDVWAGSGGVFGSGGGLAHFDGERWRSVDPLGEGNDFLVMDLKIATDGDVWVAISAPLTEPSPDRFVARYQDGVWTVFTEAGGIPISAFNGDVKLETLPNGEILLVTWDGLFAFREGAWHLVQDGRFTGLSTAPDGTIWLSGDGLFRLPPA